MNIGDLSHKTCAPAGTVPLLRIAHPYFIAILKFLWQRRHVQYLSSFDQFVEV
jgi:hypothetical protein